MTDFQPVDPNFEARAYETFSKQALMTTIGAELMSVKPGEVTIALPFRDDLTQQNGFLHAGIVTTIVDSACGGAALTLMPANAGVLSVEYKINLISPAVGQRFIAVGRVLKAGRTLIVCQGDVIGCNNGREKLVATMLATMISRELE